MKVNLRVYEDEWYPVLMFEKEKRKSRYGQHATVTEKRLRRWERAFRLFRNVQAEINEAAHDWRPQ